MFSCSQKMPCPGWVIIKRKNWQTRKTILSFPCADNENSSKVEVTGIRVHLGNGERFQMPLKLHFVGDAKSIDKLKDIFST